MSSTSLDDPILSTNDVRSYNNIKRKYTCTVTLIIQTLSTKSSKCLQVFVKPLEAVLMVLVRILKNFLIYEKRMTATDIKFLAFKWLMVLSSYYTCCWLAICACMYDEIN